MKNKIQQLRQALNDQFLEREELVDGTLVALLSKEPMLLLGPPGCLTGDMVLKYRRGKRNSSRSITLKEFHAKFNNLPSTKKNKSHSGPKWGTGKTELHSLFPDGRVSYNSVVSCWEAGIKKVIKLEFSDGSFLRLTHDHPVATPNGEFVEAGSLLVGEKVLAIGSMKPTYNGGKNLKLRPPRVVVDSLKYYPYGSKNVVNGYHYRRTARARLVVEAAMNGMVYEEFVKCLKTDQARSATFKYLPQGVEVHHKDEDPMNDTLHNLEVLGHAEHSKKHSKTENFDVEFTKEIFVVSINPDGEEMTYDIQMTAPANNFVINGIIVHNTAKSAIIQAICGSLSAKYFGWMMGKLTTPEELFGPLSLKGLEQDKYTRNMEGKLATADIVFLDEVFKGSSAILNTLLTAMNERIFYNDGQAVKIPMQTMFSASNELPQAEELSAMYDRFVLRYQVERLQDDSSAEKLFQGLQKVDFPAITIQELMEYQKEVATVVIPNSTIQALIKLRREVDSEGILVSDRKWVQITRVLRAYAYLNENAQVLEDHLEILHNVLWSTPEQRAQVRKLVGKVSNPVGEKILALQDGVAALAKDMNSGKLDETEGVAKMRHAINELEKLSKQYPDNQKLQRSMEKSKGIYREVAAKALKLDINEFKRK